MKRFITFIFIAAALIMFGCDNSDCSDNSQTPAAKEPAQKIASLELQNLFDNPTDGTVSLKNMELSDDNIEITINKALTVVGSNTNLNNATIRIQADGVSLDNINNMNVIVEKSVGNGSTKITSSSLNTLSIYGGGINSIYIEGSSIKTTTLAKVHESSNDEFVRLVCDDKTSFIDKLDIQKDSLLYNEGKNNFSGKVLSISDNVTLGSNASFSDLSGDYAAVTVTDKATNKKFVTVVKSSSTLNQEFFVDAIEKTFESVPAEIIKSENDHTPIDFTQKITGQNNTYIVPVREYEFVVTYDKAKADGQRYTLTDTKNNKSKVLDLTDDINDRSFHSITDDMGNVYFTQKSGSYINLITLTYSEACKIIKGEDGKWTSAQIVKASSDSEGIIIIDKYAVKLAVYKKGATRHLFVSYKRLWDADNIVTGTDNKKKYYLGRNYLSYYNIADVKYNNHTSSSLSLIKTIDISSSAEDKAYDNIPGIKSDDASTYYFYSQGLTVDDDENIYIDINKFDVTTDTDAGTITFDCRTNSIVRKYTTNITDSTFSLNKTEDKSYSDLGITTSYTFTNSITANPITLWDILSSYTFGITDMYFSDGKVTAVWYDGQEKNSIVE